MGDRETEVVSVIGEKTKEVSI